MKSYFFISAITALILVSFAGYSCLAAEPADVRLRAKADSALVFCKGKGMNADYCLLVDMSIHSGRERLWVWDFNDGKAVVSSLCAHGCGGDNTPSQPVFSNVPGSNCTSLGKYRLGVRSYSKWGINVHYKMHGLETTNDNAYKRIVVLHSYTPMPTGQTYPAHLPMGWSLGCPVVSDDAMRAIDEKLSKTEKPVLLWIYY